MLSEHPTLARFEATEFLQVVTLLSTYERRMAHVAKFPLDEKPPAVSSKKNATS